MKDPTPKQNEVLQLLADGLTSDQIAVELGNSKRTIDSIRIDMLSRFRAENVAHLVAIGFRNEWIS